MRQWLLIFSVLSVTGCADGEVRPTSEVFDEDDRLMRFQRILTSAADELDLPLPRAVIAPEAFHEQDTRAMRVQSRWPLDMVIQVEVRSWFLRIENDQAYRHGALHEMCHVFLFHGAASFFTPQQKELEAEHCVFRRVDEDDYFAVVRRIASRRTERQDLIALSQLDEKTFRTEIRRQFGLPESTKKEENR